MDIFSNQINNKNHKPNEFFWYEGFYNNNIFNINNPIKEENFYFNEPNKD
jgi:hypothetical protein